MSSNSSSEIRIDPQPAFGSASVGSSQRGPIQLVSEAGSTTPIEEQLTVISKGVPLGAPLAITNLAPTEMGRLLLGQRLGHYDLLEFVGGGGMGAVFKAHDTMLDRIVAVKVLAKIQSDDEETLRRFKNEAQSAARLDHDNIGRVHYVGEDRGWHYIVFEFIEGVNLRDLVVRDGPMPLAQAVSYTLQVADALAHASQRDVVHRDIKPSNVLITPEGRAKLVDMGLARLHQVAQSDQDLTASGVTLGTFDYISPEQARDPRNADVRSDLYSLGCTLYFILTGRPPFPEGTVLQKLLQHQADEPTDARQLRPDLPDELSRILKKLLAKSPQHRYQRPDDLVTDLLAVAARYGLEVPPPSAAQRLATIPAEAPRWVRHLPWSLPLAVLGVVVLGFALIGAAHDDAGPPPIRHAVATEGPAAHAPEATGGASSDAGPEAIGPSKNAPALRGSSAKVPGNEIPADAVAPADGSESDKSASVANPSTKGTAETKLPLDRPVASEVGTSTGPAAVVPIDDLLGKIRSRLDSFLSSQSAADSSPNRSDPSTTPLGPKSQAAVSVPLMPTPMPRIPMPRVPDSDSSVPAIDSVAPTTKPPLAAPSASASAGTPAAATSTTEQKATLIVDPAFGTVRSSGEFVTLADACRAARNGDIIELHVNGRLNERPIDLLGIRLTIRAGDGFSPVISFQPRRADPLRESHSMMTLAGSQLVLAGLQLELDVPRDAVAENWSMAEIRSGESLRLDDCTLTVRNASESGGALHPDVSMFDIRAVPEPGLMSTDDAPIVRPPASLRLTNCILRGEATVVRSNELQPVQLVWQNGLLATTERFLSAIGGQSDPKPQGEMQIELRHVTALMRAGLCHLTNSQDAPQQLPLEITAADCIFVCDASAALVEQSGIDATDDYRGRLVWNGERNFYEGFTTFWRINAAGAETPVQSTLHDWTAYWGTRENSPSLGKVAWQQLPPASRPVNQYVPADFALQPTDNPARHAAPDGADAGLQAGRLPPLNSSESVSSKPTTPQAGSARTSDPPSPVP